MRKVLLVLSFVLVLSTTALAQSSGETVNMTSGEVRDLDISGSHQVELQYVDGGAALSIDGYNSIYFDNSPLQDGDKFVVNGLVAEVGAYGYSPESFAEITFREKGSTITVFDDKEVQFLSNGEVHGLKLNYVDGGASVKLNGEETPLGEELQTGDTFSAGGATIEVEQTGYEGQEGFMTFQIQRSNGDGSSEKPEPVISMPEQVSVGEEFEISSIETEDPDGGEITDSLAHVTTEGHDMTLWNVQGLGSETYSFEEPGEYTVRLYVEDDEDESAETTKNITVKSIVRPELEEEFQISEGDRVSFGPDNVNGFEVDSVNSDLVNIVPESEKADTGVTERVGIVDFMDIEFRSGLYRVSVVERGSQRATMKLVKSYSSDFSCEDYETGENEYKFCSNQGDEAVKEVDLGYNRSVDLNFVNNYYINNEKHTTLSGPESALTITHEEGQDYRGARITVNEWRGLQRDEDYEAIVQVEIPEREPEASLEFSETTYTSGENAVLTAIAEQDGLYRIELEGPDVNSETDIEKGTSTIEVQPNGEGTLEARAIAPGNWWNPLDNNRVVATTSTEIRKPVEGENHQFGERFTIQEGETTKIEDHDFHLSTLSGREETGYSSILWRESEERNTSSGLVLLKQVDSVGLQYDDNFEGYGTVCNIDPETGSAEVIIKQERFNPWESCERHPSELRENYDYEMKDYELGELVTLEPGHGLKFGNSTAYLEEIETFSDTNEVSGYKEWIIQEGGSNYWNPPTEGHSTVDRFYEGSIATATCEVSESEIDIVMQDTGTINSADSEWPEDWCNENQSDEKIFYDVDFDAETSGNTVNLRTNAEARGGIDTINWDFNDDNQFEKTGRTVNHTFENGGDKEITMRVVAGDSKESLTKTIAVESSQPESIKVIDSCSFSREDYDAAGIQAEAPRLTAILSGSTPGYEEFDIFWRVNGRDIGERGGVEPGTALPAVEPHTEMLEPGTYSLTAFARAGSEGYVDNKSCGSLTIDEEIDIQPEIEIVNEDIELQEEVSFRGYPEGDYQYSWDLNNDNQYETDGRDVATEYDSSGEKTIRLKVTAEGEEFERERSFKVERPHTSSSLSLSKTELTAGERLEINYDVSPDIAENNYRLVIRNPSGEKIRDISESSESGSEIFVPDRETEKGSFKAELIAEEGFLSDIMRSIFGPEQRKSFTVISASENLDVWREHCQENGFDPLSSSGRAACISQEIGPECFKENPGAECREIANSVCEYYLETDFDPEIGKCGG